MIQLRPGESFPITYRISDPSDTGTYYVQAKIYNSRTNSLLATVNLADQGNGRFQNNYQVPGDSSGQGFYIDINVNVYDDSGYTSKSANYQQENRQYLVQERVNPFRFGGGGGADIDYKRIAKIISEVVATIKFPDMSAKMQEVYDCVKELETQCDSIQETLGSEDNSEITGLMAEHKSVFESISSKVEDLKNGMDTLGEQVLTGVQNLADSVGQHADSLSTAVDEIRSVGDKADNASFKVDQIEGSIQEVKSSVEAVDNNVGALNEAFSHVETVRVKEGLPVTGAAPKKPKQDFHAIAKLFTNSNAK